MINAPISPCFHFIFTRICCVLLLAFGLSACGSMPILPGPTGGPEVAAIGECGATYDEASYRASDWDSVGVRYNLTPARPTFIASPYPVGASGTSGVSGPTGYAVSGAEMKSGEGARRRGLVLKFDYAGRLIWGHAISHCQHDEVHDIALFKDGTMAVVVQSYQGRGIHTVLIKLSADGSVLFERRVVTDPCPHEGCYARTNAQLAIDHHDESVVVMTQGAEGLSLMRYTQGGGELSRATIAVIDDHLVNLAIYQGDDAGAYSNLLLGGQAAVHLLSPDYRTLWSQRYPTRDQLQVASCLPRHHLVAVSGVEYFSNEHILMGFNGAGMKLYSFNASGSLGTTPYGLVRGEMYTPGCTRQNEPEYILYWSDGGSEKHNQAVGLIVTERGVIEAVYDASSPMERSAIVGSAGPGLPYKALLLYKGKRFHVVPARDVGWVRR